MSADVGIAFEADACCWRKRRQAHQRLQSKLSERVLDSVVKAMGYEAGSSESSLSGVHSRQGPSAYERKLSLPHASNAAH